ncbi:MAG: adenylate/guanylate cyclase domain-containing protein [Kiritimatiellae bacterium]|nr:adenylate/guanylate cyclase domain-containing protein [Kiritimatiellia bacterium]
MRRRHWIALLIGMAGWALWRMLAAQGALERLEQVTWDWRARWTAAPSPATDAIRIVLLDQASLDWARREMRLPWPWPREVYGPILDFCRRAGARAVALDLVFTEPSVAGVADDEALGAALARNGRVAAALYLGGPGEGETTRWPADGTARMPALTAATVWSNRWGASHAAWPIPEVATNAAMLGSVSDTGDSDGVFRRVRPFRVFDGRLVPMLGLALRMLDLSVGDQLPPLEIAVDQVRIGPHRVPLDREGRVRLRFRGASGTHRAFSAAAVIQSELRLAEGGTPTVDPAEFRDRYVLVGASAPALLDLRPTPLGRVYPGVEIHATALDNLLAGDFVRPLPLLVLDVAAMLWCLVTSLAAGAARRAWQVGLALVAAVAGPFCGALGLAAAGWYAPAAWPSLAGLSVGIGAALYNYATEGRQKAFIQRAFRHYLGPEVIEQLLADPSRLRLGGEKRQLTIFFSDIEKFSTFSERLDPPQLTRLLNEYLTAMGRAILDHGGYVDKYIGDAIVAFWNAPVEQPDHARRAVFAALACQQILDERRAVWAEQFGAELHMRIGLNTGEVVVGNMGSEERFNYTVLGDAANLASRLEGANKFFGSYVMVADTVREAAGPQFVWRRLGRIRVVGRRAPVTVWEPLGTAASKGLPEWLPEYDRALALAEEGRFAEAAAAFEHLGVKDPVSRAHAERCRRFAVQPPADWDGVWTLEAK